MNDDVVVILLEVICQAFSVVQNGFQLDVLSGKVDDRASDLSDLVSGVISTGQHHAVK